MAVESVDVISPQDCLHDSGFHQHRRLVSPPRPKPRRITGNRNPNPAQTRSRRREQGFPSPPQSKPKTPSPGPFRMLKRGEELTPPPKLSNSVQKTRRSAALTKSLVPVSAPAAVPINFIGAFYAGMSFQTSPPPSSLPVPGFCKSTTVVF